MPGTWLRGGAAARGGGGGRGSGSPGAGAGRTKKISMNHWGGNDFFVRGKDANKK